MSKDQLGDWLEMYKRIMEVNYWAGTECTGAAYDEEAHEWAVNVVRGGQNGGRETVKLRPKHLVLATGVSGFPSISVFPGAQSFKGEIHHSSKHGDSAQYAGKKVVVIGSNNSAHDISAALWENGAEVTMVQRSSTLIARTAPLMELTLDGLYSERAVASGLDHHTADLIFASFPYRVMPSLHAPVWEEIARRDADLYKGLEEAGFLIDFGEDKSGLFMKYLRRGSGYYIDVGASQLIIDREIKLKRGEVDKITESAVVLNDGTKLEADLIGLATGYGPMNEWAAKLISLKWPRKWANAGAWAQAPPKIPDRGRASCAICGSRRSNKGCGFMGEICINPGIILNFFRCRSKQEWKEFLRRFMELEMFII